ncbi:uncharacterized protein CCOS01_14754 [Colletotrichum costaricense]|uniref:Uncharacterized protein n=1 Tax=Colletotrichum costaricense TaxID=1209916 RepID=A0AAI9YJ22_9PEZI|nr:uncharacterized protein CCOS01_14754 [Colletotrichum costaricense]KAK1512514.1 hypothetical protein CCOS01_14754 [Colletotrichum costaricense]
MDTEVGDGDRVDVIKEELKVGPSIDVTPYVAEPSTEIVGDGLSDGKESVGVGDANVASVAKLSVTVAVFVVDAEAVDDSMFGKFDATDSEVRSEIGVELKELVSWLAWMERDPDVVLVIKSKDGDCVIEEVGFETESTLLVNGFEVDADVDVNVVFANEPVRETVSLVDDGLIEELLVGSVLSEAATVVLPRNVVLREKVLSVMLLDSRLVRSEDVPLKVNVRIVVESEEVKVTSVSVLENSSVVELLLNVGISVDEREVVDEARLIEDDKKVEDVVPVEIELIEDVEELEKIVERAVVEVELLDDSVVERVEVVELRLEEEIEGENDVGTLNVAGSVLDVVVSAVDVDDVRKIEDVEELVVFANGPPVDVEESCVLLVTSMLVVVRDEAVIDSEEVKEDVGLAVDDRDNKELDELAEETDEGVEVDKKLNAVDEKVDVDEVDDGVDDEGDEGDDEGGVDDEVDKIEEEVEDVSVVDSELVKGIEEESEDEVDDKVKGEVESEAEEDDDREVKEEVEGGEIEDGSVVDSDVDAIVEEEVEVVEDEFEKKVKDETSVLDSEFDDAVDDVLDSVVSVVVGTGGTSRKPKYTL